MLKLNCNSNTGNNNTYDTILCRITLPPLQAGSLTFPSGITPSPSTPLALSHSRCDHTCTTYHAISPRSPTFTSTNHPEFTPADRYRSPRIFLSGLKHFSHPPSSLPIMPPFLSPWYGGIHTVRGRISNTATLSPGSEGDPLTKATEANRTRPVAVGEF